MGAQPCPGLGRGSRTGCWFACRCPPGPETLIVFPFRQSVTTSVNNKVCIFRGHPLPEGSKAFSLPGVAAGSSPSVLELNEKPRPGLQVGHSVPGQVDKVPGHHQPLRFAVVQPLLASHCDQPHQGLGLQVRVPGVVTQAGELVPQDLLHLDGDLAEDGGE